MNTYQIIFGTEERVQIGKILGLSTRMMSRRVLYYLEIWRDELRQHKENEKKRLAELSSQRVINIMLTSTRKQRTVLEIEHLRHFIIQNIPCIPHKDMSPAEMHQLCNEVDWINSAGKSIIFLQGDFGNCYYFIARGEVALYLEPSKDKEMSIARQYGKFRGKLFPGLSSIVSTLGINIANLPAGKGFGETSILSATHKFRNCAAVVDNENTILMILHTETYNNVLRRHHFRQQQLTTTVTLLQELKLFNHYAYSQICNIAYEMRSSNYSSRTTIVQTGQPITNILLIASGEVKVMPPVKKPAKGKAVRSDNEDVSDPAFEASSDTTTSISSMIKRLPPLAVACIGRGCIIGEQEMHNGRTKFDMSYVVSSSECQVLEIPKHIYLQYAMSQTRMDSKEYKSLKNLSNQRQQDQTERTSRADGAMRHMMTDAVTDNICRYQLNTILPHFSADPTSFEGAPSNNNMGMSAAYDSELHLNTAMNATGTGHFPFSPTVGSVRFLSEDKCNNYEGVPIAPTIGTGSFPFSPRRTESTTSTKGAISFNFESSGRSSGGFDKSHRGTSPRGSKVIEKGGKFPTVVEIFPTYPLSMQVGTATPRPPPPNVPISPRSPGPVEGTFSPTTGHRSGRRKYVANAKPYTSSTIKTIIVDGPEV